MNNKNKGKGKGKNEKQTGNERKIKRSNLLCN